MLGKTIGQVSPYHMNVAVANGRVRDAQAEAREIVKDQLRVWFDWIDRMLDIHRANFVFREAFGGEGSGDFERGLPGMNPELDAPM